ncbi:MAG: TonB-dependent receptor [Alphaproteobacteria bacterium]
MLKNIMRGVVAALFTTVPAFSQEEAPAPTPQIGLDEIIVTAQKRAESVQDVPISMSAIDSEFIKEVSIGDLNELSLYIPNVKIGASPTAASMYIRGLGSGGNRGFEQSVGLFVDGIYFGRINYLTDGMVDLNRVEVLRGPQGTLFGKNTVAGALSIWTGMPSDEWTASGSALFGEHNHMRFRAMVSGPVVEDTLSFRLAGMRDLRDGLVENRMTGIKGGNVDKTVLRGKLRFTPTESLDITIGAEMTKVNQHGPGFQLIDWGPLTEQGYKAFDSRAEADGSDRKTTEDKQGFSYRDSQGGNMQVNWALGDYDFTSISGYSEFTHNVDFDADFGPAPLLRTENDDAFMQFNQELRLASPTWERFDFIVGLFYYWSNWNVFNDTPVLTQPIDNTLLGLLLPDAVNAAAQPVTGQIPLPMIHADRQFSRFDQFTNSYALFGQATWRVTEKLSVIGGLRAAYERKEAFISKQFETGLVFQAAVGSEAYEVDVSREETNVAPKFSLKYDVNEDIMAYATFAQGYKAGGFNPTAGNPGLLEFDAEQATSYEVGIKTKILGGSAIVNLGAFYTNFKDLQTSSFDGSNWVVSNAAEATTKGLEAEVHWQPFEALRVTAGVGYTRARFDDYRNAPCYIGEEGDPGCDKTGQRLPGAPELNGSLSANMGLPLGNLPMLAVIGGDIIHQSEIYLDGDLDPNLESNAATRYNLRLGLTDIDRVWTFMVIGKNLTDELVLAGGTDVPLQQGTYIGGYFAPRLITAEFRIQF